MAVSDSAALSYQDQLRALARELDSLQNGAKGKRVGEFATLHGKSVQTLYRELSKIGWSSGRKRRADAGTTSVDESTLDELGAALRCGVRKNGKATLHIPTAASVLSQNGRELRVSNQRLATLLRQRQLDSRTQRAPTAHASMRSLHPNHVHLVDPSLCLLYYSPKGKQLTISDAEAYKNKPQTIQRIGGRKCWRYVLTDHYSGSIYLRYVESDGESTHNLYDFLLYCWARQEGRPQHGVPKLLVWDKGSANTASSIKCALKALQVEHWEHQAGNPRAKGAVEVANNLVEVLFESRLKFEPVHSVEELNASAAAWSRAYNADAIPHYDARLHRRGMAQPVARSALWQTIRQEQLRLLPEERVCRYLLSAEPQPRKVSPALTISFAHPMGSGSQHYKLAGLPDIYPGRQVMVSPLVYGQGEVVIGIEDYRGDVQEHVVAPRRFDALSGQPLDAAVWGEGFAQPADTAQDTAAKRADAAAYPELKTEAERDKAKAKNAAPFGGTLDAHSHLAHAEPPAYMDRRGTELSVPDRTRVELRPLSHMEAFRALVPLLGRPITPAENEQIRARYPAGVPEPELPALAAQLRNPEPAQQPARANAGHLKLVG
jgi:hypothetical protein